jgi:hypothetical protein
MSVTLFNPERDVELPQYRIFWPALAKMLIGLPGKPGWPIKNL